MKKRCPKCGGRLYKDSKICFHCGWNTCPSFLSSGEQVIFSSSPSLWWTMAWMIGTFTFMVVSLVIAKLYPDFPFMEYLSAYVVQDVVTFEDFLIWLPGYLYGFGSYLFRSSRYENIFYTATNKRIVRWHSFRKELLRDFPITQIRRTHIRRFNPLGRLLGYGTLKFYSGPSGGGKSKGKMVMKWVAVSKPKLAKRAVEEVIRGNRLAAEHKAKAS